MSKRRPISSAELASILNHQQKIELERRVILYCKVLGLDPRTSAEDRKKLNLVHDPRSGTAIEVRL